MRWYQWLLWRFCGRGYAALEDSEGNLWVRPVFVGPTGVRLAYWWGWSQANPLVLNDDGSVTGTGTYSPSAFETRTVTFTRWWRLTPDRSTQRRIPGADKIASMATIDEILRLSDVEG